MLFEQKKTLCFLLGVAVTLSVLWGRSNDDWFWGAAAFLLFLLSIWRAFVPVYFEINTHGITHWTFGRRRFIAWDDIRSYRIQPNGILLYSHANPYPLESFRGFYLPVPELLREDIHRRFVFFVDRIVE